MMEIVDQHLDQVLIYQLWIITMIVVILAIHVNFAFGQLKGNETENEEYRLIN